MSKCENCGNIILYNTRRCPHCGAKNPEFISLISIMPFNPFFFLKKRFMKILGALLLVAAVVFTVVGMEKDAAGTLLAFASSTEMWLRIAIVASYGLLVLFVIQLIMCAVILFFSWVFFRALSTEHQPQNCEHEMAEDGNYCEKCGLIMNGIADKTL